MSPVGAVIEELSPVEVSKREMRRRANELSLNYAHAHSEAADKQSFWE